MPENWRRSRYPRRTHNSRRGEIPGKQKSATVPQSGMEGAGKGELMVTNYYRCPGDLDYREQHASCEWQDEWSCACNDKCSICNAEIEPYESVEETESVMLTPMKRRTSVPSASTRLCHQGRCGGRFVRPAPHSTLLAQGSWSTGRAEPAHSRFAFRSGDPATAMGRLNPRVRCTDH